MNSQRSFSFRSCSKCRMHFIYLIALFCVAPSIMQARIFQRHGGQTPGLVAAEQFGWETAYEAPLKLNQGDGLLQVLSSKTGMDTALERLRYTYEKMGGTVFLYPGSHLAWGVATLNGRVSRFLVFTLDNPNHTLLVRLDQTQSAFVQSLSPPDRHSIDELPAIPGLQPTFYAGNGLTGSQLQSGRSSMGFEQARAACAEHLQQAGWQQALQPASGGPDWSGCTLFTRSGEICLVSVYSTGSQAESLITTFHKRQR